MRSASLERRRPSPGPARSERSCAWTCVVTSITGICWSAAHSTRSISAPYLGSRTRSATLALPVQVTLPGRCQSVGREGRQRDPRLGGAVVGSTRVVSAIGAPALRRRREGDLGRRQARRQTEGAGGDAGLQHVTTIHLNSSPWLCLPGRVGIPSTGMSRPSRTNPHRTRQRSVPEARQDCRPRPAAVNGRYRPEIGLAHAVVGQELATRAGKLDAAVLQHVAAMGDLERGHDVLLDQQDGEALLVQAAHDAEDLLHDGRARGRARARRT